MRVIHLAISALLLIPASPVLAQRVDGHGVPFRPWDVDATAGFHSIARADGSVEVDAPFYDDWSPSWAGALDVGRYWTSHLKTEVGLTTLSQRHTTGMQAVVVSTGETGRAFYSANVHQTQVTLAGTYQFLENTFTHPYVSAGVRVGVLRMDVGGPAYAEVVTNGVSRYFAVQIPTERRIAVRPRPFVALGSKSYFSERVFAKPEIVLGFNSDGASQFGLRLGIGVDF